MSYNVTTSYKGYEITPTITRSSASAKQAHAMYTVRKDGNVIHEGTLLGPFNSDEEASGTIETAARCWIDQHGK